jgi:excisionase family DNA binding protein
VSIASPSNHRWLSLGPASRLVGVDPDTLRRWADEGRVEAYVTPGGHRRFDRRAIETLVASRRSGFAPVGEPRRQPGTAHARLPASLRARCRRDPGLGAAAAERERYRAGRPPLVEALVAHLDAAAGDRRARERPRPRPPRSSTTSPSGSRLRDEPHRGRRALRRGPRPFLDELTGLGRRRALDAARLARLYERASGLLDRLLVRFVETYLARRRPR